MLIRVAFRALGYKNEAKTNTYLCDLAGLKCLQVNAPLQCREISLSSPMHCTKALESTTTTRPPSSPGGLINPTKTSENHLHKISRAMQVYLERARKHEKFIEKENHEFSFGRRHLANMMGWDPENITQEDIDAAIAYLLPSGLFEPRARPMMKPPEDAFPQVKAAQFDVTGRPFHYLFYTAYPNFYDSLHKAVEEMIKLNKHAVQMFHKGVKVAPEKEKANLESSRWMNKNELEVLLVENIKDDQHEYFTRTMTRLAEHPYSDLARDFIMKFRIMQHTTSSKLQICPLKHDELGNPYSEGVGARKTANAVVIVRGNGTGKVVINGCISATEYFAELQDRLQIMFPLQFTGLLNKVDVDVTLYYKHDRYDLGKMAQLNQEELKEIRAPLSLGQGSMCEAGAIRLGLARALCSFVTLEEVELMRLAGLLTRDPRTRERKKPGQEGARRKFTWRKR